MWIAFLQHSPEDAAIGLGLTKQTAALALIQSYPNGLDCELDLVEIRAGQGFRSIQAAVTDYTTISSQRHTMPKGEE